MIAALILFIVPVLLFVLAFLYETYVSFRRLAGRSNDRRAYLSATWEITHTLLVFAVVMLIMLFTQQLDQLASAIFVPTFLAAAILAIRAVCYVYIFYVRSTPRINWIDWLFAVTHVLAAALLVVVVLKAVWFILTEEPTVNSQFIPYFLPGLALVMAVCAVPIIFLYQTRK